MPPPIQTRNDLFALQRRHFAELVEATAPLLDGAATNDRNLDAQVVADSLDALASSIQALQGLVRPDGP